MGNIFQAYLRNKEIFSKIILHKNIINWGDLNYVETFKDCIMMSLIFTDFHQTNYIITHND